MRSFKLPSSYLRHPAKYQTPSVLHFTNKNQFGKSVFCKHLYPRFSCPQRQTICFSRDKNDHVQTVRRCRRTCRITVDTPSVTPQPEEHSPTESLSVLNGRSCRFCQTVFIRRNPMLSWKLALQNQSIHIPICKTFLS